MSFEKWRYMTLEDVNMMKACSTRQDLIKYLDGERKFYGYIIVVRNFLKELKELQDIPYQAIRNKFLPRIEERVRKYLAQRRRYVHNYYQRGGAIDVGTVSIDLDKDEKTDN